MDGESSRLYGVVVVCLCAVSVFYAGLRLGTSSAALPVTVGLGAGMVVFFWLGYLVAPDFEGSHDTIVIEEGESGE